MGLGGWLLRGHATRPPAIDSADGNKQDGPVLKCQPNFVTTIANSGMARPAPANGLRSGGVSLGHSTDGDDAVAINDGNARPRIGLIAAFREQRSHQ